MKKVVTRKIYGTLISRRNQVKLAKVLIIKKNLQCIENVKTKIYYTKRDAD